MTIPKPSQTPGFTGAISDADRIRDYLVKEKKADLSNIRDLRDEGATRKRIIEEFKGLAKDDRIQKGDPILIYFAGHGASTKIPDWRKHLYADEQDVLEVICPVDIGSSGGIPDFTVSHLLNFISLNKGNNIASLSLYLRSGDLTLIPVYILRP